MAIAYNTQTSFLGIAKEATFGTKVAPTAFIPVTSFKPDDKVTWLEDKGYRGSMVETYDYIQGPITSAYEYGGNVHLDTVGYSLASLLSDVATTGASAPYTTKFAAYNGSAADPSYTLTDVSDAEVRAYPGCMCTGVDFKFAGNTLLTYDAKWTGVASLVTTKPTATWGTTYPAMPGWNGAVKIGGTAMTTIESGEINIACPVTEVTTVGSQSPYVNWSGLVAVTGKLTVVTTDASYRTAMLAGTNTSINVTYTQGANSIALQCSSVKYKTVGLDRSKTYLEWSIDFEAIANTTDIGASGGYSPIAVTLLNGMPSGTYK